MVKVQVGYQLKPVTLKILEQISNSLMKSKNWVVESSVLKFGGEVNKFLAVEQEVKDYLELKKDLWKDDIYSEMLRYHLSKGFILKNSIRKIIEMVQSGVNPSFVQKSIDLYLKLSTDEEYKSILFDLRYAVTGDTNLDIEKIRMRLERRKEMILR